MKAKPTHVGGYWDFPKMYTWWINEECFIDLKVITNYGTIYSGLIKIAQTRHENENDVQACRQ